MTGKYVDGNTDPEFSSDITIDDGNANANISILFHKHNDIQ